MVICVPPAQLCLTCPGCTVRSTPSWWSGKSLCSHGGPDNRSPAAVAGRPVGPAPDSEPSWSPGTVRWWRPTPLLRTRETQEQWFTVHVIDLTSFVEININLCTCVGGVTCIIHDVKEFMFWESTCVFIVLEHVPCPTAGWLPHWSCRDGQKLVYIHAQEVYVHVKQVDILVLK